MTLVLDQHTKVKISSTILTLSTFVHWEIFNKLRDKLGGICNIYNRITIPNLVATIWWEKSKRKMIKGCELASLR